MGRPAQPASFSPSPVVQKVSVRTNGRQNDHQRTSNGIRRKRSGILWGHFARLFLAFGKARLAISHLLVTRQSTCPVALTDKAHNSQDFTETARSSKQASKPATRGPGARVRARQRPHCGYSCGLSGHMFTGQGAGRILVFVPGAPGTVSKPHTGPHERTRSPATTTPSIKERQPCCSRVVCVVRQNTRALGPPLPPSSPPLLTWKEAPVNVPRALLEGAWKGGPFLRRNWGPAHGTRTPERRSRR